MPMERIKFRMLGRRHWTDWEEVTGIPHPVGLSKQQLKAHARMAMDVDDLIQEFRIVEESER